MDTKQHALKRMEMHAEILRNVTIIGWAHQEEGTYADVRQDLRKYRDDCMALATVKCDEARFSEAQKGDDVPSDLRAYNAQRLEKLAELRAKLEVAIDALEKKVEV